MNNPFRQFNSAREVLCPTVMMEIRYPLSLRQVEDLLFARGTRARGDFREAGQQINS